MTIDGVEVKNCDALRYLRSLSKEMVDLRTIYIIELKLDG